MTISTPTRQAGQLPRVRLRLRWLFATGGRLHAAWTTMRLWGQLGTAHEQRHLDRYLAPEERVMIPRLY